MTTSPQTPATPSNGNGNGRAKKLIIAASVFALIGAAYGAYYFTYGQYHQETDDAYVGANLVYVNSQVGGTVVSVGAEENQPVKVGQPLIRLDQADAEVALADAEGRLGEIVRQIRQQYRNVDEAKAVVSQRKTELDRVQHDLQRRKQLAGSDALAQEDLDHAKDAVSDARDALSVSEKQLASARVNIDNTTLRRQPSVQRARAAYMQAYLAAQRNQIVAPVDGMVARKTVQVGQRVAAGTSLLAVVPLQGAWVDANFKESQLRDIRIGQPVKVTADIYGNKVEYKGKVIGISAGSGAAFSLLPPQNATGNWIKVVQRVPVRIALDTAEMKDHPLRVGLSIDVNVDTHDRSGQTDIALPVPNAATDTPVFDTMLKSAQTKADAIIAREAGHDE